MPIEITCVSCKVKLKVPDTAEGKNVKCPKCGLIFAVKTPAAPSNDGEEAAIAPTSFTPTETCVFISHAVADTEFVKTNVQEFFKSQNIATWCCSDHIPTGTNWRKQIMEGLNKSDWFVLVISKQSVESENVRKEVEIALELRSRRILPILMEPCAMEMLHPELLNIQYMDFTKDVEKAQNHLLVSMIRQLRKESQEWKQTADRQSQNMEDLKAQNAQLFKENRELEEASDRLAEASGNWPDGPAHGSVPRFIPLSERKVPIVSVCNFKGGAGKTTMTANLGATLWSDPYRKRVLLIDLDYQASLTTVCLDAKIKKKLSQQERFVQEIFNRDQPKSNLAIQLAHEVIDTKTNGHEGFIIATDEHLSKVESQMLGRWMLEDGAVDQRYLLRSLLHSDMVKTNFDLVLIDCPPRMTSAAINAFLASDFVLLPTPLEGVSTEAVPRLLKWIKGRRKTFLPDLNILGVLVSRTKRGSMVEREKELYDVLKDDCHDAWGSEVVLKTCIPSFPEITTSHRYPAQHSELRGVFSKLFAELFPRLTSYAKTPLSAD